MKNHTATPLRLRIVASRLTPHASGLTLRAFTLIELLVVISIIAILAALLLPVLSRVKVKAQVQKSQLEANQIANAIHTYESDYSKFPVSIPAMNEASLVGADFTYGTYGLTDINKPNKPGSPASPYAILALDGAGNPLKYQTNNAEVMAVLLDVEYWPAAPTVATINLNHVKNPQRTKYLNAKMSGDTSSAGIGTDGVYRDSWGLPYFITIDLNYDDKARDSFYRSKSVSQSSGTAGFNGLFNSHTPPTPANGNSDFFECNSPVMVWSAGPDRMVNPSAAANVGVNKDNILSWKQ